MGIWINRVEEYLSAEEDIKLQQAKIAITQGGLFGVGPD